MGWQCPRCGACYAPIVMRCENCKGEPPLKFPATPVVQACLGCGAFPCVGGTTACGMRAFP